MLQCKKGGGHGQCPDMAHVRTKPMICKEKVDVRTSLIIKGEKCPLMSAVIFSLWITLGDSMVLDEEKRRAELAEWYEKRDDSNATVEVATAFSQAAAWGMVDEGWKVDSESWQGGWRSGRDCPGWIILLSRPRRWFNKG
ncbi:MAG: hypothetical protein NHG36_08275 [Chromatiaceae bacterium]|nr:hypothetical protein [Candidatus Thioaporhodococcus sediminis]